MITTLLLDVGGVLEVVDDANWPKAWMHHWFDAFGIDRTEGWQLLAEADLPDTTSATGTELPYQQAVGRALGLTQHQVDLMFADMWNRYCGRPNTELLAECERLRGKVGLAILSNSADGARREEERRYGFSRLFSPIVYSHETGAMKPDPSIYWLACEAIGAEPKNILFIDDTAENVEAARAFGMQAHLHTDNASTLEVIRAAVDGTAD